MIDDSVFDQQQYSPQCTFCRHVTGYRQCAAFSGQIPMPIWTGEVSHREPYEGDNGITFEAVSEQADALAEQNMAAAQNNEE